MADEKDQSSQGRDVLLIAEVNAYLLSGETLALLPFKHEQDVRAEVSKFVEDWAKTGFLLKENHLYPWVQVKQIEVVSVQALTHEQAAPYLEQWQQDTEAQKTFWKTQKQQEKQDKGDEKK